MQTLQLENICYAYADTKKVLDNVNTSFSEGYFYAINGPSGAGKTTLLSLLAGIDQPSSGTIYVTGKDMKKIGYAHYRHAYASLVFQNYNLIDYLNAIENLRLVNRNADISILEKLGLSKEEMKRNVLQLSGGQQQRVAIARAIVSNTPILLADEPTGNLDPSSTKEIIKLLQDLAHEYNKCVIVVTHSQQVANHADIVYTLRNKNLIKTKERSSKN